MFQYLLLFMEVQTLNSLLWRQCRTHKFPQLHISPSDIFYELARSEVRIEAFNKLGKKQVHVISWLQILILNMTDIDLRPTSNLVNDLVLQFTFQSEFLKLKP